MVKVSRALGLRTIFTVLRLWCVILCVSSEIKIVNLQESFFTLLSIQSFYYEVLLNKVKTKLTTARDK